ncbi:hypothetical protein GCM10020331_006220 [Ectobacillus funiculus]
MLLAQWLIYLFEALGLPKVRTEVSVSYVDHNTLQAGFENADDHAFLQTISEKNMEFIIQDQETGFAIKYTQKDLLCREKNFIRLR